ncbi:MAG TPA: hypothetical protein VK801_15660 [Caulobacteraceae bacterium]|jgi:hypothetical protein|nr:hypothetical protein [Caulobacteraceae bacterium]
MENVDIEQALGEFRPRSEVYLQGGVGEPLVLRELLRAHQATLGGVRLTSRLLPQMKVSKLSPSRQRRTLDAHSCGFTLKLDV